VPFEVRIPFYCVVVLDCVRLPEDARSLCVSVASLCALREVSFWGVLPNFCGINSHHI